MADEADCCCRCSLVVDEVVDVLITFEVDVREAALPSIGLKPRGAGERSLSLLSQMPYPWWWYIESVTLFHTS